MDRPEQVVGAETPDLSSAVAAYERGRVDEIRSVETLLERRIDRLDELQRRGDVTLRLQQTGERGRDAELPGPRPLLARNRKRRAKHALGLVGLPGLREHPALQSQHLGEVNALVLRGNLLEGLLDTGQPSLGVARTRQRRPAGALAGRDGDLGSNAMCWFPLFLNRCRS